MAVFLRKAMLLPEAERRVFVKRSWDLCVAEVLQEAVDQQNLPRLSQLLVTYHPYIDGRDYDGSSALHAAAQAGHLEAVQLPADPTLRFTDHAQPNPPLHRSRLAQPSASQITARAIPKRAIAPCSHLPSSYAPILALVLRSRPPRCSYSSMPELICISSPTAMRPLCISQCARLILPSPSC